MEKVDSSYLVDTVITIQKSAVSDHVSIMYTAIIANLVFWGKFGNFRLSSIRLNPALKEKTLIILI